MHGTKPLVPQTVGVGAGGFVDVAVGVGHSCGTGEWTGDVLGSLGTHEELTLVLGFVGQRAAQAIAASFAHLHLWDS